MNKQRLLELAGIAEARVQSGHIGTVSNSFMVRDEETAELMAHYLRKPEIGWHTNIKEKGTWYEITLTINVDTDNLE